MESRESFSLRRDFADTVDSASLKNELFNALSQRKPFSKFKYIIDGSGDYREKWFTFKDERMQEWVKEQIDIYNRSLINDDNEEDDDWLSSPDHYPNFIKYRQPDKIQLNNTFG